MSAQNSCNSIELMNMIQLFCAHMTRNMYLLFNEMQLLFYINGRLHQDLFMRGSQKVCKDYISFFDEIYMPEAIVNVKYQR